MRDEAEIKGHRRTYIGAMPGKLVQALKQVKVANPVIMLDEIDKIGASYQGDPASALLEVLDPEQNNEFLDHYLDVRVDLSKVLFIATANQLDTIPRALLDRMDVIRLGGYIASEKLEIAKSHLWPRMLERNNVNKTQVKISDSALKELIEGYAREAGVKGRSITLTGQLGKVMNESAQIAHSFVTTNSKKLGIEGDFFTKHAVHVHVPEGATPKDGPSAGISMASALVSLAKGVAPKKNVAMTGELTLTGEVLPVGGIREKVIAAKRTGISELILPEPNRRDYEELPKHIRKGMKIHFAKRYDQVFDILFKAPAAKKRSPRKKK